MYRSSIVLLSALLLASCAADQSPPPIGAATAGISRGAADAQAASTAPAWMTSRGFTPPRRAVGVASLPDRGELVAYDAVRRVRREGAFTSYPINLSEAHAFRSAHPGGSISLRTPDGRLIQLAYQRHVEHPDGNWTWIGRQADGSDAVITFGERAVYGSIEQRSGEPLRLTTVASGPWLVETDSSRLATGNDGRPEAGDFKVPPSAAIVSGVDGAGSVRTATGAPTTASAAAPSRTVDVALGYTVGFASQLGGASQAVTRLNNLIEVTNQAYLNSGVDARVRLVSTVQVNYPDATDNGDTLEALTGYSSDTNRFTTPDPAFSALRAARDQYGADLASVVKAFRSPENAGCGIAWLVGGDRTAIDNGSAPFGYSVVSDGQDVDGTTTYFCREETLAHELGHNMGQAHNAEDSKADNGSQAYGAHTYAFGWRESQPGCFYTVMAYRSEGSCQQAIRYFSNPAVLYAGRPTGVANTADNARSLNQTVPLVALFRSTAVAPPPQQETSPYPAPVSRDMDGDGQTDFTWYNPDFRSVATWFMANNRILRHAAQVTGAGYSIVASGDYNGDGRIDVIWRGVGGDLQFWMSNGTSFYWQPFADSTGQAGQPNVGYPNGWTLVASGDVDGDGTSDLVWHNEALRRVAIWFMNGNTIARHAGQPTGSGYRGIAHGDFDGNRRIDLLWLGAGGDLQMWFSNGGGFDYRQFTDPTLAGGQQAIAYPGGWSLVASADMDGDGRSDLIWHNPTSQRVAMWYLNGSQVRSHGEQGTGYGYRVISTGDYNHDGRVDLVWAGIDADLQFWFSGGSQFAWQPFEDTTGQAGQPNVFYPSGWSLAGLAH